MIHKISPILPLYSRYTLLNELWLDKKRIGMNRRRRKPDTTVLVAAALTTVLSLVLGACGDSGDSGDDASKSTAPSAPVAASGNQGEPSEEPSQPTADKTLSEVRGENGITLTITAAMRDSSGFVTISGSVTNGTGRGWTAANWTGDEKELVNNGGSMAGASLVDGAEKKRYLILRDTEGRCLCTKFTGGLLRGRSTDWYAQFPAPPKETTTVTFQVGAMPPAEIPLTEAQ
ncbi:hypothetical protein AB0J21_29410 [Streptomyces sp. NPDC049954]|uniref:hypothetical protein n=1 Tax=Streptomyces sp. NPDC049954 TaxID=3155779 RepID=UPI00343A09A1